MLLSPQGTVATSALTDGGSRFLQKIIAACKITKYHSPGNHIIKVKAYDSKRLPYLNDFYVCQI
jgi:hypothetical protein